MPRALAIKALAGWLLLALLAATWASGVLRYVPPRDVDEHRITFWVASTMGRWYEQVFEEVVEEYNKQHPDVHVDLVLVPFSIYETKIKLAVSTGQPPDVFQNVTLVEAGVQAQQAIPEMVVPIPEDFFPQEMRERYGPALMNAISRDGQPTIFPRFVFLMGGNLLANKEWFDKAGFDVREIIDNGWTYEEFLDAMERVQAVMREELGPEAYAFGINLPNVYGVLYYDLLPTIIGAEAADTTFVAWDDERGRYIREPAVTEEALTKALSLLHEMVAVRGLWGRRYLGMPYGQIVNDELIDRRQLAVTHADTPGVPVWLMIEHQRRMERGERDAPIELTLLPAPVPERGMPLVHNFSAYGWGVMRQIPDRGEAHTRAALEFAAHMGSPEVLARFYKAQGLRDNPWPDTEAVLELAPDVDDPITNDPWMTYLWNIYLEWMQSEHTYDGEGDWPQPTVRATLLGRISHMHPGSTLRTGAGQQYMEQVLYGSITPEEGARRIIENIDAIIEDYYRRNPGDVLVR